MMKAAAFLLSLVLPAMALAQTSNDDTVATETWWDRVGAGFFSDAGLQSPRSEFEVRAHWTGLSADDQAAVRARCGAAQGDGTAAAPSLQEGGGDEASDATATELADQPKAADPGAATQQAPAAAGSETTTTGSVDGTEIQEASPSTEAAAETGLAGSTDPREASLVRVCALIKGL